MLANIFLGETLSDSLPIDDLGLLGKNSLPPHSDGNTLIILREEYLDITKNFCRQKNPLSRTAGFLPFNCM